ncbi:NAD-dependent epimerase/dehydratase family protein [Rossellomorea vietnamensis]|uniref:NAD-dependent epimerase/dehydratase family protein n=1 Tax=Rossellomorea vietnamensis TaxID=218284 RepID=UPI001CCC20EC|nr:NAD-dependent epimerase/dehydratase family protein [Rossellomorea vietnamensis]MCA0150323.1 NAD-dependent epimerase/dehydratase family protein [Rossellomorea vietnamensis]
MSKILVTGGAGFIGSHIVEELLNNNEQVVVIDNFSMGSMDNLPKSNQLTVVKGDISVRETISVLFQQHQFKKIFHLGAIASVAASVENPLHTHQTNLEATLYLLEEARKQGGLERFVFASSAAVYGDEPTLPKKETSTIRPLTPYAIDKFASEQYVLAFSRLYDIPTAAVRFFNVFGNRQNPSSPYSGVVSILTDRFKQLVKKEETSFTLFGDGEQTRDFIYVKDVVQAVFLVSETPAGIGKVFNVGTGGSTSLNELIGLYEEITETTLPIEKKEERSGDIKESYSDISELKSLGFEPQFTMREGLLEYWNKENE